MLVRALQARGVLAALVALDFPAGLQVGRQGVNVWRCAQARYPVTTLMPVGQGCWAWGPVYEYSDCTGDVASVADSVVSTLSLGAPGGGA